jgi:DNA adenine methylase
MNHGLLNYIGGKHRLAFRLVEICAGTGAEMFVDVFGGSAAVTIAAATGFDKLIYNDIDGDLVNLFRVVADRCQRVQLFQKCLWLPPSRRVFDEDGAKYLAGGHSFCRIPDPIERARCTLYRHSFCFGGKVRNGGFCVSTGLRETIGNNSGP